MAVVVVVKTPFRRTFEHVAGSIQRIGNMAAARASSCESSSARTMHLDVAGKQQHNARKRT